MQLRQKTTRPPRSIPLLSVLRADLRTATLRANYAHVIADVTGRSLLPSEHSIKTARASQLPHARSNSTGPKSAKQRPSGLYG
jgi:hypothetical protein